MQATNTPSHGTSQTTHTATQLTFNALSGQGQVGHAAGRVALHARRAPALAAPEGRVQVEAGPVHLGGGGGVVGGPVTQHQAVANGTVPRKGQGGGGLSICRGGSGEEREESSLHVAIYCRENGEVCEGKERAHTEQQNGVSWAAV